MPRYDWSKEKAFRLDEDGCLIWRGVQSTLGLPLIRVNGKHVTVRRALMAIIRGRPLRMCERVTVACEKPLCCSPNCMRVIAPRTVTLRALAKHKWTDNPAYRAKMWANRERKWTDAQVEDMRARDAAGEDRGQIAASYGTKRNNIAHILAYRSRTSHLSPAAQQMLAQQRHHQENHHE